MREITTHIVEGDSANHQLKIEVLDEPGAGGANHSYVICGEQDEDGTSFPYTPINFQNGPIAKPEDLNGVTNESLLAIVIDRLEGFQSGPFACESNEKAKDYCRLALSFLQDRTRARIERGVEGTLEA